MMTTHLTCVTAMMYVVAVVTTRSFSAVPASISTAGLHVSCKLGPRWHVCRRGPILNPRPVLDSLAQTTRGNVLDFFVNLKMVSFDQFSRFLFFVSVSYLAIF